MDATGDEVQHGGVVSNLDTSRLVLVGERGPELQWRDLPSLTGARDPDDGTAGAPAKV